MIGDHGPCIGTIEVRTRELRQPVVHGLFLGSDIGWKRHARARGDLLQLIVGLTMIVNHALTESLYGITRRLLLRKLSELNLGQSTLRGLPGAVRIGGRCAPGV